MPPSRRCGHCWRKRGDGRNGPFSPTASWNARGAPSAEGVGAVRRFTRYGMGSREEVLAWDPPTHLAYAILSGFPVRNYRADVTLSPDTGGTRILWTATFDERVPGTARLTASVLRRMIRGFASGLADYAAKSPSS